MSKAQPKFSVALIAKNEEKTLPRLLKSLKEFRKRGGEVVLLDTGSTDKTVDVAKEHGCIVHEVGDKFLVTIDKDTAFDIEMKFLAGRDSKKTLVEPGQKLFDFSAARNHVATLVKNEMVAMPDCDEEYTKLDIDKINEAIENGSKQFEYNFVYSHDSEGNEIVKFMHCKFYSKNHLRWTGIIHEVLQEFREGVVKTVFGEDVIKLEHFQNHETNREQYLTGLAYDCFENPGNDRNSHYFGRELFYKGFYYSAIKELKRHIAMKAWPVEASQSMIFIAECYLLLGRRDRAMSWFVKAFDMMPLRREPLMRLAEIAFQEGNADKVIAWVAAALQVPGVDFYANHQPYYESVPHELMYWALWQKGEYAQSKVHFDICMGYQPFNPKYLHDFRFYYELPRMDFIIADTKEGDLERLYGSIDKLSYDKSKIFAQTFEVDGKKTVPEAVELGLEGAEGDWVVFVDDNAEFHPESLMSALKTALDNRKWFMAFTDRETASGFFMIHKRMIEKIGGSIFDTDLKQSKYDELLKVKLEKFNQWMVCGRAIVRDHFKGEVVHLEKDVETFENKKEKVLLAEIKINNNAGEGKTSNE